ncbi:unnamed protein product [Lymnaea stagnalis]|uniref:Uncharacterized protein n=1 Tax=Lymnaea stagnalis TaxID=6523 RepID=A0AAV2HCJ7_LYMST
MSTIAALRPGYKLTPPTKKPPDSVHIEILIGNVNEMFSTTVSKQPHPQRDKCAKPKKKERAQTAKTSSPSALKELMSGVDRLKLVSTEIANLKSVEQLTWTVSQISLESQSSAESCSGTKSNPEATSTSSPPSPSLTDDASSAQIPQPVLKKIEEAILQCLPQLPACLEFSAWLKKAQPTGEMQSLENLIRISPPDATGEEATRYAQCDVQGHMQKDGQMNISVTINFYTHQHVKCKDLYVRKSMGVAVNNSSLIINGVEADSCISDDDEEDSA